MDRVLFERLLHEDESTTLDFKKEQYKFAKATEQEKSELLKDIIGFANAWRRTDAYIVIGVQDVRGGRGRVIGIAEHLDDHSLQQFVHSRTNRPVRFAYEAFECDGKKVGVICLYQQDRPVCLEANYGKLKKDEVYVRRGSATNPQVPASPDEIVQMSRQQEAVESPQLVVVFGEPDRGEVSGATISVKGTNCSMPTENEIPELRPPRHHGPWESLTHTHTHTNSDYYVKFAEYTRFKGMAFRSQVVLMNRGSVEARKVMVELTAPKENAIELRRWAPPTPKRTWSTLNLIGESPSIEATASRTYAGEIYISEDDDRYKMEVNFFDIQPGRTIRSDDFYLIVRKSGPHALEGKVYAANLPKAVPVHLGVDAAIAETTMTVKELVKLARTRG